MIDNIIDWCVANKFVVAALTLLVTAWGAWAMLRTPLDAVPDLSDVQVIISTEWQGRSPSLIEDHVTYPIVSALLGTPRVKAVRGFTDFGVSLVYVVFEDGTDLYWARSRVVEYLQQLHNQLPDGVSPAIGPDATGVGWVYQYALVDDTGRHNLADLRGLQDWRLRYSLASVPGVAEVATIGGFVKQYQVNVNPNKLSAYDVGMKDVIAAIRSSNDDSDGRLLEFSGREYMVRVHGYLTSIHDIENVAVGADAHGTPVHVRDVADVRVGPDVRRGTADLDGRGDAVGGIVVMRHGENALRVIDDVKAKLRELQRTLPRGVTIVPTYDRSSLIRDSIQTLRRTLVEEAVIVSIVMLVFLGHVPSVATPILMLPIAVLASFIPMYYLGVTSNIMSLGGLALAIGVLVDASIVMVENAYRRVSEVSVSRGDRQSAIVGAAKQVARAIFCSFVIVVVSFVPVFLLEAQEGRMFRPLAYAKTFAMAGASVLAITVVPVCMAVFIRGGRLRPESASALSRVFRGLYEPVLRTALRWKWTALLVNVAVVPLSLLVAIGIGSEFMPPLEEGTLLYMPSTPPGVSTTEATRLLQVQDKILRSFPEVATVFGTAGRAGTATDNSPISMANTIVTLAPRDRWRTGMTVEKLQDEMDAQLRMPGIANVWTQPIEGRLDMLLTGIRTPVGLRVLGPDLNEIERIAGEVERVLRCLPDTRTVYAERVVQGYFTDIRIDRERIGRFGLTVADVEDVIASAVGGQNITRTIEGRERYPVNVRYQRDFRDSLPALDRVLVRTPQGRSVPLGLLADIALTPGPAMIRDEGGQLAGYVYVNTTTRDVGGYIEKAQRELGEHIVVPSGYSLEWTGQYEFQTRARQRLTIVIPLACAIIFVLLYVTFGSASEAATVMLSVVYAMTGGIMLQWLLGYNFSVAVWVGYLALYGVAVQTGVVMVVYLHEALAERVRTCGRRLTPQDVLDATIAGAVQRLRPKLMTVSVVILGLMPVLWSSGAGADLMKPIAAPIVGGMVTSAIHVLIITPVIFYITKSREFRDAPPA